MNYLKSLLVTCMTGSLISGCVSISSEINDRPNTAVIIFKDAPNHSSTRRFIGSLSIPPEGTLIYVDSALNRVYYTPRNLGYDTLTVAAPFGYAEVIHRNQAVEEMYYLLEAGDTVLFTYGENLRPQITSLTSERNTRWYNLPFEDRRAVQPIGYSTKTVLTAGAYSRADMVINHPVREYPAELVAAHKAYYINLDSLRPIYQAWQNDFRRRIDSLETQGTLPSVYADYYRRQFIDSLPEDEPLPSDSLMHYISHYNRAIAYPYRIAPANAKSPQHFDLIAADTTLTPIVRRAILYKIMSDIEAGDYWSPYPAETVQEYRERYERITGDTVFRQMVVSKDNLVPNGYATDLVLQGLDGKQYDFGAVLEEHRGKVVYVDMWASWCAPCLAGMPDAKKLREAYRSRDVVFIYLAINDTEAAWRGAVKSSETDYLGLNYRILNAEESLFLRQIKHNYIPHFLLYDRTGALVDMNAPRPGSEEIKTGLDKHL